MGRCYTAALPASGRIPLTVPFHVLCLPARRDAPQIARALDWISDLATRSLPQHLAAEARGWSSAPGNGKYRSGSA